MTLQSMTGFSRNSGQNDQAQWIWEIKSVNGRGLDVKFRLPPAMEALEARARQAMAQRLQRGNVQVQLQLNRPARTPKVRINSELLSSLQQTLVQSGFARADSPPDLAALLGIRGVVTVEDAPEDNGETDALEPILESFQLALEALIAMRQAEGTQLKHVLFARIDALDALVTQADSLPARKPEAVKLRLANQIAQLIDEANALDPARLHQEAVLLAAKADIREELDRLKAHCQAARHLIHQGGPVGRKLDFLSQEFVREANTLCAKSNDVELTGIGLDLKAIIEQLREQVQNIE